MNDRTLWAFGCSHTYGHGLKDCWDSSNNGAGPVPSKLGYASILAKKLNMSINNISRPGIGNKHILFRLQRAIDNIKSNDFVLLQWSYVERHCIIQSLNESIGKDVNTAFTGSFFSSDQEDTVLMLGPWVKQKSSKVYYKLLYNEVDAIWETINYINIANTMLQKRGIKSILHIRPPYGTINENLYDEVSSKNLIFDDISMSKKGITNISMDQALDKIHPGPKTQQLFADYLFDKFYN